MWLSLPSSACTLLRRPKKLGRDLLAFDVFSGWMFLMYSTYGTLQAYAYEQKLFWEGYTGVGAGLLFMSL